MATTRESTTDIDIAALRDALEGRWLDGLREAVAGDRPGAYANFMHDEGEARVHDAYPGATWDRLAAVKRKVDPTNLFRRNQNVPPA